MSGISFLCLGFIDFDKGEGEKFSLRLARIQIHITSRPNLEMIRYGLTQGSTNFFHPGIQDGIIWSKLGDLLTTSSILMLIQIDHIYFCSYLCRFYSICFQHLVNNEYFCAFCTEIFPICNNCTIFQIVHCQC